jgi:hypothetical protein
MAKSRTSGARTDSLKDWFESKSQKVVFDRRTRQITVNKRSDGKFDITDSTGKKLEKRNKRVVLDLLAGTVREKGKVYMI